jgi:hypothetical protein
LFRPLSLAAVAATVITLLGTGLSLAADDEQVKAQSGSWLVAPESGAKGCRLTFDPDKAPGGYGLSGAQACASVLPVLSSAAAWTIGDDGALAIVDRSGKVLMRFGQEEGSPWETEDGEPIWLLPALGDIDRVPSTESLAGTWQLETPDGQPLCELALLNEKDEDGNARMSPKSDCPAPVSDMKLSLWTTEGFGLVLMGNEGAALSFDMNAAGSFATSKEEQGPPFVLVRR